MFEPNKLSEFAKRMVLSEDDYKHNDLACFSILGTRVQMGIVDSYHDASEIVSNGYACLVNFVPPRDNAVDRRPVIRTAFMPDPFCAYLAMRYMDEDWKSSDEQRQGQSMAKWVEIAKRAFAQRLCQSEKGDVGEIFAALYLLFCGDILRKRQNNGNKHWVKLSVDLEEWFSLVKDGGKDDDNRDSSRGGRQVEAGGTTSHQESGGMKSHGNTMTVSFIQVCRNFLRSDAFSDRNVLEYMSKASVAWYTYRNCKAIDLAASIRVTKSQETESDKKVSYHPLFVSVKNWENISKTNVENWMTSMKDFLNTTATEGQQRPKALCLVVAFGTNIQEENVNEEYTKSDLDGFPTKDVFRLIVPKDDKFDIAKTVLEMGLPEERSEVYSSHAFITCYNNTERLLKSASKLKEHVDTLHSSLPGKRTEED